MNAEMRIARLERFNRLLFAGLIAAVSVSCLAAFGGNATYDRLTVRELVVKDANDRVTCLISSKDGLAITDPDGKSSAVLSAPSGSEAMLIFTDKNKHGSMCLTGGTGSGGAILLTGKGETPMIFLGPGDKGHVGLQIKNESGKTTTIEP